jgi:hypothetical protein
VEITLEFYPITIAEDVLTKVVCVFIIVRPLPAKEIEIVLNIGYGHGLAGRSRTDS